MEAPATRDPQPGEPLLSVVVTSRNDNHGDSLLRRMQTFVNALIKQCRRHDLHAELIIVEWNPPPDRPPLADALYWPDDPSPCEVRIIQVPPHLHARFRHADNLPLFQMIAKNVGIRRARGRYVLATNIDILMSDELYAFLKSGRLRPGRMYRLDRHDVDTFVPVDAAPQEQLEYCRTHLLRVNARNGTFTLTPDGDPALGVNDVADPGDGVLFGEGWFGLEDWNSERYRWAGSDALLLLTPPGPARVLNLELEPGPATRYAAFELEALDETGKPVARGRVDGRQNVYLSLPVVPGRRSRVRLRVHGGNRPTANDPRLLNYRVFGASWALPLPAVAALPQPAHAFNVATHDSETIAPQDVAPHGAGLCFGRGWYPVETWNGERFRWVGERGRLVVRTPPGPARALALVVEPGPGVGSGPFELEVRDDSGRPVARGTVSGRQTVTLNLPVRPGCKDLFWLTAPGGGLQCEGDPRTLNFRVLGLGWSYELYEPPAREQPSGPFNFDAVDIGVLLENDVAGPEVGVSFGRGWYPVETWNGERFRWMGERAELIFKAPEGGPGALTLEMEPGPGLGWQPFRLEVRDTQGRLVARGTVQGRQHVHLALPGRAGVTHQYTLTARGAAGLPIVNDPRTLHCRVLAASWTPGAMAAGCRWLGPYRFRAGDAGALTEEDIAKAAAGVCFGRGWYPVECWQGERFRWVGGSAVLVVKAPDGPVRPLSLDVEVGPGVALKPFTLLVRDEAGRVVARGTVTGRQRLELRLPVRPGQTDRFRFQVLGGGRPCHSDPRVLNFRVFRCGWAREAASPGPAVGATYNFSAAPLEKATFKPPAAPADVRPVPVPVVWERPAPELPPPFSPVAEEPGGPINAPVFLHTNACGDFTLMAREHWFALRANPEFEMYSFNIDSLMCYMAHHGGAVEEVLRDPMRAYHIEHGAGSGWTPEGAAKLMERLAAKGIPVLDYHEVIRWAIEMRRQDSPLIFNQEDWGLGNEGLRETVIGPRQRRAAA
jgi:hypothetical protein